MARTLTIPSRGELRLLLVIGALALGPFIGLAVWARQGAQAEWEQGLLTALLAPIGLPGGLSSTVNAIGNVPVWAVIIAISTLVMLDRRGVRAAGLIALSFASDFAALVVKVIVERERPATAVVEQLFGADSFSFTSGHTVRAAAFLAAFTWLLAPAKWRVPLAVVAGLIAGLLMGYARVSLGVHWPTDVIGGTLLGLCWFALTTILVLGRAQPRQQVDGPPG